MMRSRTIFGLALTAFALSSALALPPSSDLNVSTNVAPRSARGVVSHRISACDYFIVATRSGYDVLEWYGGHDPDKGDVVIGDYESYGFHDIYDETVDDDLRIWTEDYALSKADALEKLTEECE